MEKTVTTPPYEDAVQKQQRELREKAAMLDELMGILMRRKSPVEGGWLIELGESELSSPLYFIGVNDTCAWGYGAFHHNNLWAARFCRKEDAERVAESISTPTRVCFHEWG